MEVAENPSSILKRMKRSLLSHRSTLVTSLSCFTCFSSSSEVSSSDESSQGSQQILQNVHAFSYRELKVATNSFHLSNKIGEGGFGSVYKGMLENGKFVAVKVLSAESRQGDKEFLSEIASLSSISHENLVILHGACIDGPCRILVYDYMENGNLAQILLGGDKIKRKFCWRVRREISLGIAEGLAHIHEEIKPHIVHRDIKASNILLDQNFAPKVSDFGLSKLFADNITHISTRVAGTLGYLAPEYAISGHLTRKSDIYSFGVLLLEIVSGRTAVDFDLELGEHFLVEKAWEMYKENKLVHLVDPMLNGNNLIEEEAIRFLKVALLCVQEKCGLRPKLSKAVKMMRGEINISSIEISKPGLINDFMNVKIGERRQSSQSITTICSPQLYPNL
ncbi:putative serine/threonine-protein kinase [Ricinus communis]|uniref:ATP binding protein, putative n=1 Tax=Ricinus communis TaxID=3988 RepID=B9SU98_RICCO|nr:putative serine/threonine-protein kinase [Ricinus communis]EEF32801.1 ATP binding protein, putative [Ricinus communis]|eukprot:XP_002529567.3 putative serine/threonine-protein kinase [Ricinus communis]